MAVLPCLGWISIKKKIPSEKVELRVNYTKWSYFLIERSHIQTKKTLYLQRNIVAKELSGGSVRKFWDFGFTLSFTVHEE